MWWPGDEGGWATAKLLLGRSNPAGRLPVTWARALEDYPASNPRYPERSSRGVGNKTTFSEGVDVGYRWFDRQGVEPLFPFGHGLSYTTFDYSDLKVVAASDGGLDLSVRIRNTGHADGDEAPQVYLSAPTDRPSAVQFPVRKLVAFDRVTLKAGQANTVRFHVPLRQLQYWSSARHQWVTASGESHGERWGLIAGSPPRSGRRAKVSRSVPRCEHPWRQDSEDCRHRRFCRRESGAGTCPRASPPKRCPPRPCLLERLYCRPSLT